ncbi:MULTISPECIES: ribbon-helix-helix domain-containing protein [unclassified Thalassospira]|jgi:predicted DNA-binding ribbon-helix-helix protein|uniref:ribbon-helix-helix domain-containing protein n=1 Tax=unclassified Thalassospira TaxID=2648997 RepID=UPI000A1D7EA8|nr:ribbon-helix-helix domain-containing protein [Thalassospira sp. MCCC 1A01428]
MCKIYSGTDPALYETATRSVRINGVVTSLRLELRFWQIIDEIAQKDGYSTPQFLGLLHDEVVAERGDIPNFASLLRVVCTVYLQNQPPYPASTAIKTGTTARTPGHHVSAIQASLS